MTNGWEQQPGGLWLKVSPFNKNDPELSDAIQSVMRSSIQSIAQGHGAFFNGSGFRNNERAISSGDLWVDLYLAKWELCDRKPLCLGAAFGWDTYGFSSDGKLQSSVYTEDVSILKSQLRQLIRSRPDGMDFPKESIAECLERISLNRMRNDGVSYRFGEVDPDNTTMIRQLNGNNANLGLGNGSAVLEFKEMPTDLKAKWLTPATIFDVIRAGVRNERHFLVKWEDGEHDVRFLATKGQATAAGQPRVDIRPWHNGNLPEQRILESVVASSITTIKQEADFRGWGHQERTYAPAPLIPASAPHPVAFKALYDATGDEIGVNASGKPATFKMPVADAHTFVMDDQRMLQAFTSFGAKPRLFGDKPMVPGVNTLKGEMILAA